MFGLGLGELVVILVVVLIFFGGSKLPQLGSGLGEGIRSFRKAFKESQKEDPAPPAEGKDPPQQAPRP